MSSCTHTSNTSTDDMRRKRSQTNMCESQSLQSLITCPQHHDFKLIIEKKSGPPETVHLYALTMQEKAAWISDISQVSTSVYKIYINVKLGLNIHIQYISYSIFNFFKYLFSVLR